MHFSLYLFFFFIFFFFFFFFYIIIINKVMVVWEWHVVSSYASEFGWDEDHAVAVQLLFAKLKLKSDDGEASFIFMASNKHEAWTTFAAHHLEFCFVFFEIYEFLL